MNAVTVTDEQERAALTTVIASTYGITASEADRGAARLLAAVRQSRRSEIAWNLDSHPHVLDVPDLTRGAQRWPDTCDERWTVPSTSPVHLFPRTFPCTRIWGHTGRHAAGSAGRITAVWAGDAR